jgi:hypothetical protein
LRTAGDPIGFGTHALENVRTLASQFVAVDLAVAVSVQRIEDAVQPIGGPRRRRIRTGVGRAIALASLLPLTRSVGTARWTIRSRLRERSAA